MNASVPTVSVILAAYNEQATIHQTIGSITIQTFRDLELIVVDDGSTDETPAIVARLAEDDERIRLIRKSHEGLTAALRAGCAAARGEFIARQDAGDLSTPPRIELQLAHVREDPSRALVSCTTRYRAPGGELLYESGGDVDDESVRNSLLSDPPHRIHGISHHGSAFFRRADFERVGGYRKEFLVAQDIDLWIRLAKLGNVSFVPQVLYEAVFRPRSISAGKRRGQMKATACAAELRDHPESSASLLSALESRLRSTQAGPTDAADGWYFIGRCLQARRDPAAGNYLRSAIRERPFFLRARLALLQEFKSSSPSNLFAAIVRRISRSLGRVIRWPLALIPGGMVIPVLTGPARGLRWISGSATHGCWIGTYESRQQRRFARLVSRGSIVFDIGANVGFYTILAARLSGTTGAVHAFEPLERNLACLRRHCEINALSNVTIHDVALADTTGDHAFSTGANPAMGGLAGDGSLRVRTRTLDDMWGGGELPDPDLLKIDVEGAEMRVLQGAEAMLKASGPKIFLSAHGYRLRDECTAFLEGIGYRTETMVSDSTAGNYELLFTIERHSR